MASSDRAGWFARRHLRGNGDRYRRRPTLQILEDRLALSGTSFGDELVITEAAAENPTAAYAADLDGDGDLDILSSSYEDDKIAWYENLDGEGSFGPQQVIESDDEGAKSVFATDLDGDGDLDVLSAWSRGNTIAWYENLDGEGSFGAQQVITSEAYGANSVFAADLDGDGDLDVLSSSWRDNKIAWYENVDGNGSFGTQQVIITDADGAQSVRAADLDDDGDLDVLFGANSKVAWHENLDGRGAFGPRQEIMSSESDYGRPKFSVFSADLDGDGDIDVLSGISWGSKLAWYENLLALATPLLGDMNLDDTVDHDDIDGLVLGLIDPAAYEATYGLAASVHGDIDQDGDIDYDDIRGFVELLDGEVAARAAVDDAAPLAADLAGDAASLRFAPSASIDSDLNAGSNSARTGRHELGVEHRSRVVRQVAKRNAHAAEDRSRANAAARVGVRTAGRSAMMAGDRTDAVRGHVFAVEWGDRR